MLYDNSDGYYRYLIEVFRVRAGYVEAVPARDRFEYISLSGHTDASTSSNEWELPLAGYCDSLVCDLRVGMIPEYTGYYGIAVRDGYFGKGQGGAYCESLRFRNLKIESNGGNNFANLEPELGWGKVRINEREYEHPETEETLYFFKVE